MLIFYFDAFLYYFNADKLSNAPIIKQIKRSNSVKAQSKPYRRCYNIFSAQINRRAIKKPIGIQIFFSITSTVTIFSLIKKVTSFYDIKELIALDF